MSLSDLAVKSAKPKDKAYKLVDGRGLCLLVSPTGAKYWRFNYRFDGKQKTLAVGVYPVVTLKDARERCEAARKLIEAEVDPSSNKKARRKSRVEAAANSFEVVSREWLETQKPKWTENHYKRVFARLEKNVWPKIGKLPISQIKPLTVLDVLRVVEKRGAHYMAGRVKESIGNVMRYAIVTGRAEYDPTPSLKGALTVHVEKHMASVTDPKRVGQLLRAFEAFTGTHAVRVALNLAPYVFARPGELRQMQWADLQLKGKKPVWSLDRGSMKMRRDHAVPLSKQAVALIKEMEPFSGHLDYVFPGARDPKRPMSDAAINAALRRLGIDTQDELTGHGFRAMARTILRERLKFDAEVIECQLSHAKQGPLGAAYDRTLFMDDRFKMMQQWADYLDGLRDKK